MVDENHEFHPGFDDLEVEVGDTVVYKAMANTLLCPVPDAVFGGTDGAGYKIEAGTTLQVRVALRPDTEDGRFKMYAYPTDLSCGDPGGKEGGGKVGGGG